MKKLVTLIACTLCIGSIQAQSYYTFQTAGSDSAYDVLAFSTSLMTEPANNVLTATQALPFAWDFYGQPVTHYVASDNGYITFDTTASTSFSNNGNLPDVGGPNNAIYAFWDDLELAVGSGAIDEVVSWTYGTTPNRTHVVEWFSVTPFNQNGTAFMYAAILIHEGGDFDIVLPYAFDCAGLVSATIGCEDAAGTDGLEISGSPTIDYLNNDQAKNDDIVHHFVYGVQPSINAKVQIDNIPPAYTSVPIKHGRFDIYDIKVTNIGNSNLTGVKLKSTVDVSNGPTYYDSLILGSLASGAIVTNDMQTSYIPTASSNLDMTVEVWSSSADADSTDNMVSELSIDWVISDTLYSKDNGTWTNGVGFNTGPGSIGNDFIFQQDDTLTHVAFELTSFNSGDSFSVSVYNWLGDTAGAHVYTTPTMVFDGSEYLQFRNVDMDSLPLNAGHYAIVIDQHSTFNNMALAHGGPTGYGIGLGPNGWFISSTFNTPFVRAIVAPANTSKPSIISKSVKNVKCNGESNGSITINVIGGTKPYTYLWSNTDTTKNLLNIGAGTYSVIITDSNSNIIYDTLVVSEPAALTSSLSMTDESCGGYLDGTVDLTAGGGSLPYSYAWSNNEITEDLNGIGAGRYVLNLSDNNGCSLMDSIDVGGPTAITLTLTSTDVSCFGKSDATASVTHAGGVGSRSVMWSTGSQMTAVNGVGPGTLTVTITDTMGCEASDSVIITEPLELTAILDRTNVSCFGENDGEATIHVQGGVKPYDYNWSSGGTDSTENNQGPGMLNITITDDNGCAISDSTMIVEPAEIVLTTGTVDETGSGDGKAWVTVTGGTMPYTYAWNNPGQSKTDTASNLSVGTYTVTVTDSSNCQATKETFINLTGIDEMPTDNSVSLYPNPVSDYLYINFDFDEAKDVTVTLINMLGQNVQIASQDNLLKSTLTMDLQNQKAGIYLLKFEVDEEVYYNRLVKD